MVISTEKMKEILEKYSFITDSDVIEALNFTQEILEAEADALKEKEPYATTTINRLNAAAYEVFEIANDIDFENFVNEVLFEDDEPQDIDDDMGFDVFAGSYTYDV